MLVVPVQVYLGVEAQLCKPSLCKLGELEDINQLLCLFFNALVGSLAAFLQQSQFCPSCNFVSLTMFDSFPVTLNQPELC